MEAPINLSMIMDQEKCAVMYPIFEDMNNDIMDAITRKYELINNILDKLSEKHQVSFQCDYSKEDRIKFKTAHVNVINTFYHISPPQNYLKKYQRPLKRAIRLAEGHARVNTITLRDIYEACEKIECYFGIQPVDLNRINLYLNDYRSALRSRRQICSKTFRGLEVQIDVHHLKPDESGHRKTKSTHFTLKFENRYWWVTDIRRDYRSNHYAQLFLYQPYSDQLISKEIIQRKEDVTLCEQSFFLKNIEDN